MRPHSGTCWHALLCGSCEFLDWSSPLLLAPPACREQGCWADGIPVESAAEFAGRLEVATSWRGWHGTTRVWRGSGVPFAEQGVKILGAPLGYQHCVRPFLSKVSEKHQILFQRIPGCPTCSQHGSSWSIVQRPQLHTQVR